MSNIAESAQELIVSSEETKENLLVTTKSSKDVMNQSIYIATKTKELIANMDEVIEVSEKNTKHRDEVENVSDSLGQDAKKLKDELSKFKV